MNDDNVIHVSFGPNGGRRSDPPPGMPEQAPQKASEAAPPDHGRGAHDRICALPGVTEPSAVTERRVHPSAFIEALVTASETAQLIVVRAQDLSRHRRHDRHLDDHDGEIIVHAAECPVMIVPTPSGVVDSIAHRLLGVLHV